MDAQTAAVWTSAIAAVSSLGSAAIAAASLYWSKRTHGEVNGRMTQMIATVKQLGETKGFGEGRIAGRAAEQVDEARRRGL